jgi:hypothetical protein
MLLEKYYPAGFILTIRKYALKNQFNPYQLPTLKRQILKLSRNQSFIPNIKPNQSSVGLEMLV